EGTRTNDDSPTGRQGEIATGQSPCLPCSLSPLWRQPAILAPEVEQRLILPFGDAGRHDPADEDRAVAAGVRLVQPAIEPGQPAVADRRASGERAVPDAAEGRIGARGAAGEHLR